MSEKHLAERLMYPLPDGWRDDPEQVAALKEIWPKIITKNKELIDAEIASLRAQLDEARAENDRLSKLVYVPGLWRCAKCKFQLIQANLNAGDGSVTARDQAGDKCPNCDAPLWRVTEREAGNKLIDDAERVCMETAARIDEARRKAIEDAAQVADEYALKVRSLMRGVPSVEEGTAQSIAKLIRALLSESKT